MIFRKGYTIVTILMVVFSLAAIIIRKYSAGGELNILVILSLFSIVLFFSSFYFLTSTYHWNSCLKERSLIEDFMEDNINDYKKLDDISKREDLNSFISYLRHMLMRNDIYMDENQMKIIIENGDLNKIINSDKINNKHKKIIRKSINNFVNSVSLFSTIKMKYKSGMYSKNMNYSTFFTLLSISISIFAISSFSAFKLYDSVDITFSICIAVVFSISVLIDFLNGANIEKNILEDTYNYLIELKNKTNE